MHIFRLLPCNNQYINFRSCSTEYRNYFEYSSRLSFIIYHFISGHRPLISSLKRLHYLKTNRRLLNESLKRIQDDLRYVYNLLQ